MLVHRAPDQTSWSQPQLHDLMKRVWVVGGETRHTNGYKFHVWFLVLNIQGVKIWIILVFNEQTSSELEDLFGCLF